MENNYDDFIPSPIVEDPREVEEKERDYKTSNIMAFEGISVEWKEKDELKGYTPREQSSSLSCMAQSGAKGFEAIKKIKEAVEIVFSAHPPYRSRMNYPEGGMWLQDLGNTFKKIGTNLESVDVSQGIGESQMNRDIECETPYKIKGYGFPDNQKDIDDIAYAIEKYGHCIIVIYSNKSEWVQNYPTVVEGSTTTFGHGVCAVDYFLKDGKKYLKIEDSTGHSSTIDKKGERHVSEEFIKARCAGSMYFLLEEPQYIFKTFMKKGYRSTEVKELQKRLNKEKIPDQLLVVDGIFGAKTDEAVRKYQEKHGLVVDGLVGIKTRTELNK